MKTSIINKTEKIKNWLDNKKLGQGFEAAARFQAMKKGAKWIDTYPLAHQMER